MTEAASGEARAVWAAPAEAPQRVGGWDDIPPPVALPRTPGERVTSLLAWSVCGFAFAGSILLFPVGLLALPVPIAIAAYLANARRPWPEVLGLAFGAAGFLALVAYWNRDSIPCSEQSVSAVSRPGEAAVACGGTAPGPWLALAVALLSAAVAVYVVAALAERSRRGRAARLPLGP